MPPTNLQRPTIASLSAHVDDHEQRIEDLEQRLNKYDVIIARLDTIIDIMTQRIEATASKAENAIKGQELIEERNENANRWSAASIAVASSLIVGILMFILGYLIH